MDKDKTKKKVRETKFEMYTKSQNLVHIHPIKFHLSFLFNRFFKLSTFLISFSFPHNQ